VTLDQLQDCKMPSWVFQEWKRLNKCHESTMNRYFPGFVTPDDITSNGEDEQESNSTRQDAALKTDSTRTDATSNIEQVPHKRKRLRQSMQTDTGDSPDLIPAVLRLPNPGSSNLCWVNAVMGFLLHRFHVPLPGCTVSPPPNMNLFRRNLYLGRMSDVMSTLRDWQHLEQQFSSTALIEYLLQNIPQLFDRFAISVNSKKNCPNCGNSSDLTSTDCVIRANAHHDFGFTNTENTEHGTLATVWNCSCGSDCTSYEYFNPLSSHICVVHSRGIHDGNTYRKLTRHLPFPTSLCGKTLIVAGEHIGDGWQSGHWIRHERVGESYVTVSDMTATPCPDITQVKASFLIYG
jgi:hypothetical protein